MANILLVEPDYKNKYPPLGLMKICTYHKMKGDNVYFCKGMLRELRDRKWDRIYISTLFTFYWEKTIKTIKYYYNSVYNPKDIFIGGVMATILKDDISKNPEISGITIISGLIDKPGVLGDDDVIVDNLPPDYGIINPEKNKYLNYNYPVFNAYIVYATRGCIRSCSFCAVHKIEPNYVDYIPIKEQVEYVISKFGPKKDLMLLDNNILASKELERIINDIVELGFGVGNNKFTYTKNGRRITVKRYVDFNQGVDARLLTEENMKLLSKIAIKPLRIAFDYANPEYIELYMSKVRLAAEYGIKHLSNYILFNYKDKPEDFYNRLRINVELNEEFERKGYETRIFSFPMKYTPTIGENCKNRYYVGVYWNKKLLRGIQCVLNATHGVVGPKKAFFEKAFGANVDEFIKILLMPEDYIINRETNKKKSIIWKKEFDNLREKKSKFIQIIGDNKFRDIGYNFDDEDINRILKHYLK
ncbi:MAG: cobalamin-binding domain-containing protein [Firmicutes bacterium]|nr:cobalamin-binding domain-containing protein [Bacillota bacterium]